MIGGRGLYDQRVGAKREGDAYAPQGTYFTSLTRHTSIKRPTSLDRIIVLNVES